MSADDRINVAIASLTAGLRPVKRAPAPPILAAIWIGAVAAIAVILAAFADDRAMLARLGAAPDLWLAVLGSALTALLAAVAAMQLSTPDARARWAALPLPGLALWLGASGFGCLRTWIVPGVTDATLAESRTCFTFILLVSAPLSVLMIVLIRRAYSLRPNLTTLVAGLGVAAAANTLLNFFHPYDASATDLAVHLAAVLLVIGCNRALAIVLPDRRRPAGGRGGAA